MSVLYLLVIAALIVAIGFLVAFIWAVKSGQYDDTHTPSMRIILDDNKPKSSNKIQEDKENGN